MGVAKMKKWKWCSGLSGKDICVSVWCSLSFIGLGTTLVIIGPTLLDLADHVGVGIAELAAVLFGRSVGSVVGAGGSGFVCDRFHKESLWILSIDMFVAAILTCVIPLSPHIAVLGVFMFFHGFCLGAMDNGVHAILMKIWKNKDAGPIMQIIHFMFAFGAFLAPLSAKPFISDQENHLPGNVSCLDISSIRNNSFKSSCWSEILSNCTVNSGSGSGIDLLNISLVNQCADTSSKNSYFFGYAYWVAVIPLLFPLPPLIYFAVKQQSCCQMFKRRKSGDLTEADSKEKEDNSSKYPSSWWYKGILLTLLFVFMAIYVGMEVSFGTYLFAFAVKGDLRLSKQRAAVLSSVFWGTFSFARCASIAVSLCNVPPSLMMTGNLTGTLIAATLMVISPNNETVIWVGSALLGTSFSSIYPTTMSWMSQHIPPTGKTLGVLGTGAVFGDTLFPLLVGVLLDKIAPVTLIYFSFAAVLVSTLLVGTMFIGSKVYLRHWKKRTAIPYKRLQFEEVELTLVRDVGKEDDDVIWNDSNEAIVEEGSTSTD